MKNVFLIIVIFVTICTFSQESINFDLLTVYSDENGPELQNKRSEMILTNSNDSLISMCIRRNVNDKKLYGVIKNSRTQTNHFFHLINDTDDILNSKNIVYQFSVTYKKNICWSSESCFDIVKLIDNQQFNTKIICYKNKKKKGKVSNTYLNITNSDLKYYNNFKRGYLHHFDNCQKLNINFNKVVNQAQFHDYDGKVYEKIALISNEPVNLNVIILKIKKQSILESTEFFDKYFN